MVDRDDDGLAVEEVAARCRLRDGSCRVRALTGALALVAALLVVASWAPPVRDGPWWIVPIVVAGYAAATAFVFHVEFRRDAVSFGLSEIPTALALVFLSPVVAIAVRAVGSVGVVVARKRSVTLKEVFNAALFSLELAVAFAVVRAAVGLAPGSDGALLLGLLVATALSSLLGPIMVPAAIACFEGGYAERVRAHLGTAATMSVLSATVAVMAVAPALVWPALVLVCPVPIVAVWFVVRRHGLLLQQHRDLEAVHDFSRSVGRSLRLADVATVALDAALASMRAGRGTLLVHGPDGAVVVERNVGGAPLVAPAVRPGTAADDEAVASIVATDADGDPDQPDEVMVVPIGDRRGRLATLVLADRLGAAQRFDHHDARRATRLGEQLASKLRNSMLHADIEHAALHDSLTGSRNRPAFEHHVTTELGRAGAGTCAVLLLDLDRFKEVNDTFGHHMGDRLLVEFARQIGELLEADDVLARFGGGEFAVFVRRDDVAAVRDLGDRIVTRSHRALHLDRYDVVVATSVGIATAAPGERDATAVIRRADIAMFAAKHDHLGYEVYREEIDQRTPERLALLAELRCALERDEFDVHFQPKLDLATSCVVGVEALVRWNHPSRGPIPPDEFIRVAEESGLIRQLTDQVLNRSLATLAAWRAGGLDLHVAVNLSALDLVDEHLVERVRARLREHGLAADLLTLEITESSLMVDTPRTTSTVRALHQLGVRVSLDDFGTG